MMEERGRRGVKAESCGGHSPKKQTQGLMGPFTHQHCLLAELCSEWQAWQGGELVPPGGRQAAFQGSDVLEVTELLSISFFPTRKTI